MNRPPLLLVALILSGALLTACTATQPQEVSSSAAGAAGSANAVESLTVTERPVLSGSHLLVRAEMTNAEPVSKDTLRQIITDGLREASREADLVELVLFHDDEFVDAQAATNQLAPGVWFNPGGPVITGEQAQKIAAG